MSPRNIGIVALIAAVGLAGWGYTLHQRQVGALNVLLHQADSVAHVAFVAQGFAHDSAVDARTEADKLRHDAQKERAKDATVEARTDSSLAQSDALRRSAERMAGDAGVSVDSLRATIVDLVRAGRADSVAFAAERTQHERTVASLLRALVSDSTAIQRGVAAENAALQRAVASENTVRVLKASRPSVVGNVMRTVGYLAIGYGVARIMR